MEQSSPIELRYPWLARYLICGAAMALCLVVYGVFLIPSTSALSITAGVVVLLGYAAVGIVFVPRLERHSRTLILIATWAGLAAGIVFALEVSLEYVFLPKDNSSWGVVEFGLVFFIYLCSGALLTRRRRGVRGAVLGAALTATLSSIFWCIFVLGTFVFFYKTGRQDKVFRAEGDHEDFARSGMRDFPAFIMEDFLGATFFHLLLGPLIACLLGLVGGWIGKAYVRHQPIKGSCGE